MKEEGNAEQETGNPTQERKRESSGRMYRDSLE